MIKKLLRLLLVLLILVGCASNSNKNVSVDRDSSPSENYETDSKIEEPVGGSVDKSEESKPQNPSFGEGTIEKSDDKKKIITSIFLQLETKQFDEDLEKINTSIKSLNGSIQSLKINEPYRYKDYTSRTVDAVYLVPYDNLDEFLENFKGMSIITQNMSSEDVSKRFADNKLRIESLETQHKRLLELIATAQTVESIIVLESRLSELELEINKLKGDNMSIDEKSKNITVSITMREVGETKRLSTDTSFGSKVGEAFNGMISNTGLFFQNLALNIIYNIPLILLAGIGFVVARVLYKKLPNSNQKKKGNIDHNEESDE